jgi:RNA polymerase sigma factor (sigma-70 family)
MPTAEPTLLTAHLRRMVLRETEVGALKDEELVGRLAQSRDAAAFEVLVWRHGPMVWATCQRILRHQHDVEDAFQATFLALARTARSIGNRRSAGGWLHRVAVNAALKLRANRVTTGLPGEVPARPGGDPDGGELAGALDEELARLPDRARAAFVLCCLEGMTSAEAARELGCPVGTVDSRLHAARARLRDRLARRGFGPGTLAGLVAVASPPAAVYARAVGAGSGTTASPAVDLLATQVSRIRTHNILATNSIIGATVAVVIAGAAWAFGGPGGAPRVATVARLAALAPAPVKATRGEGRIVLWREGHPVAVRPSTKEVIPLVKGFEGKRGNLWLGPDGKRVLVYIANRGTVRPDDPDQRDRLYIRQGDGGGAGAREVEVKGVSLCHAFWGATGETVFGYGLAVPVGPGLAPAPDLTTDLVNWSFDVRTGRAERLSLPGNVSVLDRSADGKAFLVISYEKASGVPGAYRLGLLPAAGGTLVPLTKAGEATPADFRLSPDGRSALGTVYRAEGGNLVPELVVIDLKTLARRAVAVQKGARACGACWSPDGKRVAFAWEPKAAYERRAGKRVGPVIAGEQKYELRVTVARPDGSEARDVHAESRHWYGSIDWR